MKKLLVLCLTAVLCLCCLASCGSAHKENEWFSEEKLTNCLVGDLPTIEKEYVNHNDEDIYVSFTSKEREAYVAEVFEYLKSQNFKYLGTRGEQASTLAGSFTTYYFKPATELSEFYVGSSYKFVYSDGTLDEGGDPIFCILTIYDYEAKNLEYGTKNFAYNTLITLRYKSEAPLSGRYALNEEEHEHTGEWVEYNQHTHYYQYTCGCTLPDRIEKHVYNDGESFCNICGYDTSDEPPLVDETISLTEFASWLTELNAENVVEIKTTFEYIGVAPGRLKDISKTTDKIVIADVLKEYVNIEMREFAREDTYIEGGSAFTIEFTLTDGTIKELYFNNSFYAYGLYEDEISALCYFKLNSIPTLKNYDNVAKSKEFITYIGTGTVYDKDNNAVCEIPIDKLEFVESDGCVDAVVTGYYYTVETEFGTLYFDYSNDLFYLQFDDGKDNYREYYRLVGKNLDELIAEYSITTE